MTNTSETTKFDTDADFERSLKRFIRSNRTAKATALICATMSLEHFAKHGDVSYIQRFDDELSNEENRNWNRVAAYRRWLAAHAPLTMAAGKYKKDVSENARKDVDLEGAMKKPFWEFAPSRENFSFDTDDIVVSLEKIVKRFHSDKVTAKTPAATALLGKVEHFVQEIKTSETQKAAA